MGTGKLPAVPGARESNENETLFSAALGQMQSIRAAVGAHLTALEGRIDGLWRETKTKVQGQVHPWANKNVAISRTGLVFTARKLGASAHLVPSSMLSYQNEVLNKYPLCPEMSLFVY